MNDSLFLRLQVLLLALLLTSSSCKTVQEDPGPSDQDGWQVVIIGAGAGGLAAGATRARTGVKTLILEQHDKPGGFMTAFERGDDRFEVSLHMIDGLDPGGCGTRSKSWAFSTGSSRSGSIPSTRPSIRTSRSMFRPTWMPTWKS